MKPKMWSEFNSYPYSYHCIVDKINKEIRFIEGSIMPFVTQKINLEKFLEEHTYRFSEQKRIEIKDYVNS